MNVCEKREIDVEQAVLRASKEVRGTQQWYLAIERVFKETVKMWVCGEEISDVGFVLGKIVEAIEEHERGDEV